jgi:uncharacterized membrane protein
MLSAQSFQLPVSSRCVLQQTNSKRSSLQMKNESPKMDIFDKMKKSLVPIFLGASLLLVDPMNADAARSGGRSGGSSFRGGGGGGGGGYRSSPARSSTQLGSSSGSGYYSQPRVIMPMMPMYSPFGFGGGFGIVPYMPINLNLLILGGAAFAIYTVLSNRAGGSDFSNSEEGGSLGSGATVMKVQVALESDWAERGNIMNTLSMLAEKNAAMSGRGDIAKLLSEASLALLRKRSDWNSAAYEGELFRSSGAAAEPAFQKLAIKERAKFEEETSSVATIRAADIGSTPTQVVVSIVVALRGKSSAYMPQNLRTISDVSACLQGLAADALTDDGNNIMAVEVLWTPSEIGNTISSRELIEDYPELIRL